jgi:hypothetical protein
LESLAIEMLVRGAITKIMPSDGCKGGTVTLVVGPWYGFHEFRFHLGNVG